MSLIASNCGVHSLPAGLLLCHFMDWSSVLHGANSPSRRYHNGPRPGMVSPRPPSVSFPCILDPLALRDWFLT